MNHSDPISPSSTNSLSPTATVEWRISTGLTPYPDALQHMDARARAVAEGTASELVWLLEHPPLYTAGTSANSADLVDANRFPVYDAGRGGQYTYHGPGQRVVYFILDLNKRGKDIRRFIYLLETVIIDSLKDLGIEADRRADRVGVWVERPDKPMLGNSIVEEKIAAIGVRVRRWVSFHGIAINVAPDLDHFDGIIPCGIKEHGVTSMQDLGSQASMADLDRALKENFNRIFGMESRPMPEAGEDLRAAQRHCRAHDTIPTTNPAPKPQGCRAAAVDDNSTILGQNQPSQKTDPLTAHPSFQLD